MSSKTKTLSRNGDGQPAPAPKLRFLEFRDAEGWDEKRLGSEGEFLSSLTGKAGDDFDAGEAKFVTYINVFSNTFVDPKALRLVDVKEGENQNEVASGDVFFTVSSETPEEVGMSSVLLEEIDNCYLNSFCALFRFSKSKRLNPVFTGYLLRQPSVRRYFTKKAQGSTRFNLSRDAFKNLPIFVPSPPEQKQIADCLSSIDKVIAAQARKLDALKTHKNGLMQRLFPREGETQPRVRFPEFRDAGEWEEQKLVEAITPVIREVAKPDSSYLALGLRSHGKGTFQKPDQDPEKNSMDKLYLVHRGDLIVNITFAWEGAIAIANKEDHGCYVSHRFPTYLFKEKVSTSDFFRYIITSKAFVYKLGLISPGGAGRNRVMNKKDFLQIAALLPDKDEQQKIADCLTSLDDLITGQTQMLKALKIHKKGLMQQLFPTREEVEA